MRITTLYKTTICCLFAALASAAWGADVRDCAGRNMDQQVAFAKSFMENVAKDDPNASVSTPILKEIFFGHVNKVDNMLSAGVNPNLEVDAGIGYKIPLLGVAIAACQPSISVVLVRHGANVNGNGVSVPLADAATHGIDKVVGVLLKNGANPEQVDFSGDTALWNAVAQGHYSTVKILLEHGANPNHRVHGDQTVLGNNATDPNDVQIANLLRSYGALPNQS